MKFTMTVLRYFQKVAELQHVTKAAEALHVAQPSISRVIKSMEKELNVPLFERKGRNIILTSYGEVFLRHVNRILEEADAAQAELKAAKEQEQMTVRFSIHSASCLIPGFLSQFKKEHPEVNFEILMGKAAAQQKGGSDFLELSSGIEPEANDHCITLFKEEIMIGMPDTDPRSNLPSIQLADLANDGFICLHKGQDLRSIINYYCNKAGFTPKVDLESDSPETVREFIRTGLGISFIPQITWSDVTGKHVVLIPISFPRCYRYINLRWNSGTQLSRPTQLFKNYVIGHFADYARTYAAKAMKK